MAQRQPTAGEAEGRGIAGDGGRALWSLWEAAHPLLPARLSPAFASGVTGGCLRRSADVVTLEDMRAWLAPGLAACGVAAELRPLPEEERGLALLLRERLRRGIPVPLLAFSPEPESPATLAPGRDDCAPDALDTAHFLLSQGALLRLDGRRAVWQDGDAQERSALLPELQAAFSHMLRLRRAARKGRRRAHIRACLLRWITFADAFPERLFTAVAADAEARSTASAFLRLAAGEDRAPVAVRLRRAAAAFEAAALDAGWRNLREAVLLDLRLPAAVQRALLAPADMPLSDMERREMIYLARAGTLPMQVLAVRRLASETQHGDACRTRELLACSSDAWVRAAALLAPGGFSAG